MSDKRSPDELLESLLEYEHDDPDARPIQELTVRERDAALRSAGLDPDALRAKGAAHADKLLGPGGTPPAQAQDAPPPPAGGGVPLGVIVLGGLVVAAVIAALVLRDRDAPKAPDGPMLDATVHDAGSPGDASSQRPRPPPREPPVRDPRLDDLIATIRDTCDRSAWAACKQALDAAHAIDPTSDQTVEMKNRRKAAEKGLAEKAPH
jgi:hypothetical protein